MLESVPRGPAGALLPPPYAPAGPRRQSRAGVPGASGLRLNRNFRYFSWYGGVAGEGLRSVGAGGELPNQERVLYPAHRPPSTGRGVPAFARLAKTCRSADASGAGGAYGGLRGRADPVRWGSVLLPIRAAPRTITSGAAFTLRDATWGCFSTMAFATSNALSPSWPEALYLPHNTPQ